MRRQVVARIVGGGDQVDPEPPVERPGPEGRRGERVGDLVVDRVRGRGRGPDLDAEDVGQLHLQPVAHRRAAVDRPVCAERAKRLTGLLFGERTLADTELRQAHAVGVQQPVDVVVGGDQQRGRVTEREVVGEPAGRHVAVRGDDRQLGHRRVQPTGHGPQRRVGR